jgi:hypothetical protein
MRFYLSHRLLWGFWGGVAVGSYNARQIDRTTLVRGGSAPSGISTLVKLAIFVGFMCFLAYCRIHYAP